MVQQRLFLFITTLFLLTIINGVIYYNEKVLETGTPLLLELAPYDPRALLQGDYMRLNYKLAAQLQRDYPSATLQKYQKIIITLDEQGVAQFVDFYQANQTLSIGQHILDYTLKKKRIVFATDSFFFQEGHANHYEQAHYGELRVTSSGKSILIGLRDKNAMLINIKE